VSNESELLSVYLHEQNNFLSHVVMHLEDALESKSPEDLEKALEKIDQLALLGKHFSFFWSESNRQNEKSFSIKQLAEIYGPVLSAYAKKWKVDLTLGLDSELGPAGEEKVITRMYSSVNQEMYQHLKKQSAAHKKMVLTLGYKDEKLLVQLHSEGLLISSLLL
jgi:hypothetical protein